MDLSPKQIVNKLDKYIIGQSVAKRMVAIALRNRYREFPLTQERARIWRLHLLQCGILFQKADQVRFLLLLFCQALPY